MKKGFTLIELLVVISIIGLLSSIVFASLNSARQKAINARKKMELQQLVTALSSYYQDHNGTYPPNPYDGCWCVIGTVGACGIGSGVCLNELVTGGYIKSFFVSPDGNPYYYYTNSSGGPALVSTRLIPAQFNPSATFGWHCGAFDSSTGADQIWCDTFQ